MFTSLLSHNDAPLYTHIYKLQYVDTSQQLKPGDGVLLCLRFTYDSYCHPFSLLFSLVLLSSLSSVHSLIKQKTLQPIAAGLEHSVLRHNPLTAPYFQVIVQLKAELRHIVLQILLLCVQAVLAQS